MPAGVAGEHGFQATQCLCLWTPRVAEQVLHRAPYPCSITHCQKVATGFLQGAARRESRAFPLCARQPRPDRENTVDPIDRQRPNRLRRGTGTMVRIVEYKAERHPLPQLEQSVYEGRWVPLVNDDYI